MKKSILFTVAGLCMAICSLLPQMVSAQNWTMINSDQIYNYSNNTEGYITHQVWVDSLENQTEEDLLYFNRIAGICDTCENLIEYYEGNYYTDNYPQFLMKKAIQSDDYFWMQDSASMVIYPNAGLNESWLFDTTHNLTAEVTALSEENIFGQTDSVKTITVDGREIRISKSFGIIEFPDYATEDMSYQLIGIESESNEYGYQRPGLLEFYDMEVGEGKKYKAYYGSPGGSNYESEPLELIERNLYSDSLVLTYENTFNTDIVTETIYLNENHPAIAPLNTFYHYKTSYNIYDDLINVYSIIKTAKITRTTWSPDTTLYLDFGICYGYGTPDAMPSEMWYSDKQFDSVHMVYYDTRILEGKNPDNHSFSGEFYGLGFGMVQTSYFSFEISFGKYIFDIIDNSGEWILDVQEPILKDECSVFPNPADNKLYVSDMQDFETYQIINMQGKYVSVGQYSQGIDVSDLPSGLYLLSYLKDGNTVNRRFMKN